MTARTTPASLMPNACGLPRFLFLPAMSVSLFLGGCRSPQGSEAKKPEEQELRSKIVMLARQEQILTAEVSLARNANPYLAIDLAARKIDVRVQGRGLRSFTIGKIKRSGSDPFDAKVWTSIETKPLETPERARVVPGSGEATSSSVAARAPWGPQRMPPDFDVICKEDLAVSIRSLPSGQTRNRFTRWVASGYRQSVDWTRNLFRRNIGRRESIEIWMGEDDSKLLFWSLPKQFGILLIGPEKSSGF